MIFVYLVLLIQIISFSSCARILCIFPTPSISHQIVFRGLTQELGKIGHQLVIATPIPSNIQSPNITEIDLSFTHSTWDRVRNQPKEPKRTGYAVIINVLILMNGMIEKLLASSEIQNLLMNKEESFDLVIVEYICFPSIAMLKERFNCPMIGIASLDAVHNAHELIGNVNHFYMYPDNHFGQILIPNNFFERLNAIMHIFILKSLVIYFVDIAHNLMVKKYIDKNMPNIWDLDHVPDLLFVNANPVLGFSRPVVPTFVDITGIHMQPHKPLTKDVAEYLDKADAGAILFSLGTNSKIESLPANTQMIFLKAFSKMPYKILWKWEFNSSVVLPDNVKVFKWIQQNEVLAHPNVKLFIFQGGQQSMVEAVTNKVPMIGMPIFGDQFLNVERIVYLGIGKRLDLNILDIDRLHNCVSAVMTDPSYQQNVERISRQLYDTPQTPREKAIWWTEYVLRHNGTKHLRPVVSQLPFIQLYYLDVMLFALALLIASIIVVCVTVKYLVRLLKFMHNRCISTLTDAKVKRN